MLFQRPSDVLKTGKRGLVQATRLASHSQCCAAEVNGRSLRLLAILLPVGVNDQFDHIGLKE